ncbi:MAG: hypothetical protein NPIRA02_27230 [Nitrospirales bacterium]|nr:MAG: hypothetical protein NPIRA02_27230 [Nitrospirales bacterium]
MLLLVDIPRRLLWPADWLVLALLVLLMLNACVGKFETKPTLTETCQTDWQSGIDISELPGSTTTNGLHVLIWNIHDRLLGESNVSKGGHTEEEVVCIGDLAKQFDLVLFQEAFVRPAQIARYTRHAWADHPVFEEGGGGDWWPLRVFCQICLTPGLLMMAGEEPESVHTEPYEAFAGWNTKLNKADDFFSKGFQLVKFQNFWVLNSHMDSGRGQQSIDARMLQFRQITAALKRMVPYDAPILIGMDSNLRPENEKQDGEILQEFLESNGLTLIRHNGPDLIAVRNLKIEKAQSLPLKDVLSDHDALSVIVYPPAVQLSQP